MGGKSAPKAPKPTDPKQTSAATTGTNVTTAIANSWLQNMNETTPYGTKTFQQNGSETVKDPYTGKTYTIPRFSVTQTLSPDQQAILEQQNRADLNLSTLGADLSGTLKDKLTGNFTLGNEAVEGRLFDLGRKRLDPMFARQDEDLRTRLANQGIKVGTDAYNREMELARQGQNDAYNSLLLAGRGQSVQEQLTEDNQRINQISALLGGSQVSQPQFMTGAGIGPIPTTDNAAIIGNYDNNRLAAWSAQQQAALQRQESIGGILSGAGGLFKGLAALPALSDERAKEDKHKIAETKDGLDIYSFRYKGTPQTQIGLMAQDVRKKRPEAVKTDKATGLMLVDYRKALKRA